MIDTCRKYAGSVIPSRRKSNPTYTKLQKNKQTAIARTQRITRTDPFQKEYRYVKYVRYADDFLIGITGSRQLAIEIKGIVATYLKTELHLTLNDIKTKITHITKGVHFLGHV
jgi:hypothetical protein